jgi:predicted negative regulator of RcsB-dependent stress response
MALDLEEQEQIDELKAWWKMYGTYVVAALAAFVIGVGGWRFWEGWSSRQATEASALFDQAMQAANAGNAKAVKELTAKIMEDQSRSAYAAPAAWLAGRANHDSGDFKSARAQYQYALDHAKDDGLAQLARLRLAGVLLEEKDYAGAMKLLEQAHDPAYAGLYANLKGDVLEAQGKHKEAQAAYKQALERLGEKSPLKAIVEIKMDGMGV